jgi:hypothetical protein
VLELLLRVPPGKHGFRNTGRDEIWNQLKPRFQWLTTVTLRFERGNVDKFNSRFQNIFDVFNGQNIPNVRHVTVRFEDNMEIGHDNYDFLIDAIASFKYLETCHLFIKFYDYLRRSRYDKLEKSKEKPIPTVFDIFRTSSDNFQELELYIRGLN